MASRPRAGAWSEIRGSLWVWPAVAVALALATGAVLSLVEVPDDSLLGSVVFRGDAADARQLLTAVTQTMITVTSLVFVLTVVALQIASSQFSPRLLRTFLRDRGTQLVLSTFVGTVAYSLAGLHTVGSPSAEGQAFVPRLAVTGALLLALVSVGMLVYYIQHITDSIRIDTIMRQVESSTLRLVQRTMPLEQSGTTPSLPAVPDDALPVTADVSGYVQRHRLDRLLAAAIESGAWIRVAAVVGDHVVPGRPIAWVWGSPQRATGWAATIRDGIEIASERKAEYDVGFGLRQLVDIASRTLSPSLNDPYSAVQAVHHLTVVLCEMARRSTAPIVLRDERGDVRVTAPVVDFPAYLRTACDHVRWSMVHRPRVGLELVQLIDDVGRATPDDARRAALEDELDLILDDAQRMFANPADLSRMRSHAEPVRAALRTPAAAPLRPGAAHIDGPDARR